MTRVKPEPYSRAGWREVGVTARMILELGRRLNVPVYILHNDHKLHEFIPEKKTSTAPRSSLTYGLSMPIFTSPAAARP